jgi:hypothetical protein
MMRAQHAHCPLCGTAIPFGKAEGADKHGFRCPKLYCEHEIVLTRADLQKAREVGNHLYDESFRHEIMSRVDLLKSRQRGPVKVTIEGPGHEAYVIDIPMDAEAAARNLRTALWQYLAALNKVAVMDSDECLKDDGYISDRDHTWYTWEANGKVGVLVMTPPSYDEDED